MEPHFKYITASDGYRLSIRHWEPSSTPRGFVVALHGIQSHGGWYDYSSQRLCESGFDVRFMDRRGSGRNFSRRGDVAHADRLVNDVVQLLSEVCRERDRIAPAVPVVLQAVSWGGKLAAVISARQPDLVDSLALLYPGLCARVRPTAWQNARLSLARTFDIRHRRFEIPLNDPTLFTGEARWQEFIRQDRLALREVTSGFLLAHQDLTRESLAAAPSIRCPILMMLAGKDQIIDNDASKHWLTQVGSPHVTLHQYPDAQHTLEFEPQAEIFVNDLIRWMNGVCDGHSRRNPSKGSVVRPRGRVG